MHLRYFYAYWELGQFGWSYAIIPDAIFSIRNAFLTQAALEFDRNTESLNVFAKKLLQYRTLITLHPISTVILVAEHRANLERLENGLEEVQTLIPLLLVALEDLCSQGLVACPYPRPHMHGRRTLLEQLEIDAVRMQTKER
jgi:hypothetical protein